MKPFQIILIFGFTASIALADTCPEDYWPCNCEKTSNGLEILCFDVAIDEIKKVFLETRASSLYSVTLRASATGSVNLPYNLLSDKVTQRLSLQCPPADDPPLTLTIDSATFQYTRRYTTFFEIKNCDLVNQMDFAFLNEFEVLETLRLERTLNIDSFASLPTMDNLQELAIIDCTGLINIVDFPDLTPARLKRLHLNGNSLNDTNAFNILLSVSSSSSVISLQELTLSRNLLTKVPRTGSFSKLEFFDLSENSIPLISEFAFNFSPGTKVNFVGLKNVSLEDIEDGAFVGDYSKAEINLEGNKLTNFTQGAFKDVLTQMSNKQSDVAGQLVVTGNEFDCGCSLAWLIRDNPNLIPSIKNGTCDDNDRFEDLDPLKYTECP